MSTLKDLFKKAIEMVVFPAVDKMVKEYHSPFEIDDLLWAAVKKKIQERLDLIQVTAMPNGDFGFSTGPGESSIASDLKELFKQFIQTQVYPIIDQWTANWKTPFNIDDTAWKFLKAKIDELLNKVSFVKMGDWQVAVN